MYPILPDQGSDGMVVTMGFQKFYWCHWSGSAPASVLKGQAVQFVFTLTGGKVRYELQTVAAQAVYTPQQGVTMEALAAAGGVWVQTEGECAQALVTASNSIDAGGESLELIAAGTTLIYDADALSTKTVAYAMETATVTDAKTYVKVWLIGLGIVSGS
jgi:hypothetical protein